LADPKPQKPPDKAAEKIAEKKGDVSSIFILKSQTTTLAQAESFLRNRKWVVGSGTNLREALAYIIQKNPQYILVTADHPNRKVRLFPKMLAQAFPIRVIGFAEKGSGLSTKNLHEMGLEYNLYPPVSGPAIERMILKIKKEDEEKKIENENQIKSGKSVDSPASQEMITFKGDSAPGDSMKSSFEQARAALNQLIISDGSGDEGPAIVAGNGSNTKDTGFQGPAGSDPSATFGSDGQSQNSSSKGYSGGPGQDRNTEPAYGGGAALEHQGQSGRGNDSASDRSGESDSGGGRSSARSGEPDASGGLASDAKGNSNQSKNKNNSGFLDGQSDWGEHTSSPQLRGSSEDKDGTNSSGRGSRQKSLPVMESEYVPRAASKPYRMRQEKPPQGSEASQSVFVRGTQQALRDSVNSKGDDTAEEIQQASNLACITVESPRFNGYLICAMGRNRKIDKTFIDLLQQRLFKFLKDNGENIKDQDTISLRLQEVNFTAWTLAQAEFLKKSVHDGEEVAIAFFPTAVQSQDLQKSVSEKMLMVGLSELQDNAVVEFDLYIFMPENNKYLLYTPQGRPFYGNQKSRLKDKGITHMHLRKESAHEMKKYRAQNFLNEKIENYRKALKTA
jgi:hypothetical protein